MVALATIARVAECIRTVVPREQMNLLIRELESRTWPDQAQMFVNSLIIEMEKPE